MQNPESLEAQLRSWSPRQPSAKVKAALFGDKVSASVTRTHKPSWLTWHNALPTALGACALLLLTAINFARIAAIAPSSAPITLAALSNVTSVAANQHNSWSAPIFGWTTDGKVFSSKRPLHLLNTNHLLR